MIELRTEARENFLTCAVTISISTAVVALRFFTRFYVGQKLILSDYLCVLSLVVFGTYCGLLINYIFNVSEVGAFEGAFVPSANSVSIQETMDFMKNSYVLMLLFTSTITIVKLSIISFYWTIFAVNNTQRYLIMGATGLVISWWIAFFFVIVFLCTPISAMWEKVFEPGYCLSTPHVLLGYELSNLFIDVIMLCIPTLVVSKLQLSSSRKWSLIAMFLMGAAVCVASIVRLTYIWRPPNVALDFDTSRTVVWSTLQSGMAIICACLPMLGTLFTRNRSQPSSKSRTWGDSGQRAGLGYKRTNSPKASVDRWNDDPNGRFHSNSKGWATRDNDSAASDDIPLDPIPVNKIHVKRQVQVS
ncbi:unnamed protein product [Clonostachys chloroleuca]|uniref:Rhodopsin domain-containing protein n=1 Tax=Clonostachys chloroleuca TaxID=1926264 RepID=A0AA35M9S6_9HYPO|nr:unnamed protein product [Clonostachys chloroleuca]